MVEEPQLTLRNLNTIVVHDGIFHADDVRACSLALVAKADGDFKKIYVHQEDSKGNIIVTVSDRAIGSKVRIIRDRAFPISHGDMVIDTGGIWDADSWRFDHHQRSFEGKWHDSTPVASAGLVWHAFRDVFTRAFSERYCLVVSKMVKGIDARDNGILSSVYNTSQCISSFIPPWSEEGETTKEEMNNAFAKALRWDLAYLQSAMSCDPDATVALMGEVVRNEGEKKVSEVRAEAMIKERVTELLSDLPHAPILELEKFIPFAKGETIKNSPPTLKFVVYPSYNNGEFCCQTISDYAKTEEGSTLKSRCPFPKMWGGLPQGDLQRMSKIDTAKFCHKNLFLFVAIDRIGAVEAALDAIHQQDTAIANGWEA